jgi:hypothetical protein
LLRSFFLRSILRNWARKQEDTIPSFELPHKSLWVVKVEFEDIWKQPMQGLSARGSQLGITKLKRWCRWNTHFLMFK